MLNKLNLITASIFVCLMPSTSVMANISQYNYSNSISSKDIGVDINAAINCGYGYENANCSPNASSNTNLYDKNSNSLSGREDAKTLNKGSGLSVPQYNQKELGFGNIDPSGINYSDSRDIQKQQTILGQTYGEGSSKTANQDLSSLGIYGVDQSDVDTSKTATDLTSTYNTNKLSNAEGFALKNKCMTVNPRKAIGSGPQDNDYYLYNDVQCLSVRTVAVSNDTSAQSSMYLDDPLSKLASEKSKKNNVTNNNVINVGTGTINASTANQQSYACEIKPERKTTMSYSCDTFPTGRQQVCKQERKVMCGEAGINLAKNNPVNRLLPECIAPIDKSSFKITGTRSSSSFNVTNTGFSLNEQWTESSRSDTTNTWNISFSVNNRSKAYLNLYRIHYDNILTITYNNVEIANYSTGSNATRTLNYDLRPLTVNGLNTMQVKLRNTGGPAAVEVNVIADENTFKSCDCQEAWVTTCTVDNKDLRP